jgi:membrane-bound lytic murein transglycosylase D
MKALAVFTSDRSTEPMTVVSSIACFARHVRPLTLLAALTLALPVLAGPSANVDPNAASTATPVAAEPTTSAPSSAQDEQPAPTSVTKRLLDTLAKPVQFLKPRPREDQFVWDELREGSKLPACKGLPQAQKWARYYASHPEQLNRILWRGSSLFYFIMEQSKAAGVPPDLVLLPIIESQYDPGLVSRHGAAGMWQFMPGTARVFDLRMDGEYDGRLDAYQATKAAIRYYQHLGKLFNGDYLVAMAAYNVGEGRMAQILAGRRPPLNPAEMWDLPLPKETSDHIGKWVGLSCLLREPKTYGYRPPNILHEPVLKKVEIEQQISLKRVAELAKVPLAKVRYLNPAYLGDATPRNGPHYFLLPSNGADQLVAELNEMGVIGRNLLAAVVVEDRGKAQSVGPQRRQPDWAKREYNGTLARDAGAVLAAAGLSGASAAKSPSQVATIATVSVADSGRQYRVVRGDSLWTIARAHRVSVNGLMQLNGLNKRSRLQLGQKLSLPVATAAVASTAPPSPPVAGKTPAVPALDSLAATQSTLIVVRNGDSPWLIARRHRVPLAALLTHNNLSRSSRLQPGQKLKLPENG